MKREDCLSIAKTCGFDGVGVIAASKLAFMEEVRKMCAMDRCNMYNKSWTCPPATGSLEEARSRVKAYDFGIVVQTTEKLEDSFDYPRMMEIERLQKKRFDKFTESILKEEPDALPMGVGACTLCEKCTYPEKPCRFPKKAFPSMESYGLLITQVCEGAGIPYNYGEGTLTYTSMILIK